VRTALIVTPAEPGAKSGNRVTALRWAKRLRELGWHVRIATTYAGEPCDVLVALHARKSHAALSKYRDCRPAGPLVVVLTGTDLYDDLRTSRAAQRSLDLADRLVVLHALAGQDLPEQVRAKVRVVIQSADPVVPRPSPNPDMDTFLFCVLGHLRREKDPLRAARALRRLRDFPHLRVIQAGGSLSPPLAESAKQAMGKDPRYRWVGEVPRWQAQGLLARSDAMILSSRLEGGANVTSEAVVNEVPVLASRIPGNIGLLGADYSGYYPVGDTRALAELMWRASEEPTFYAQLLREVRRLKPHFTAERERESWQQLLQEFA
jgi:putative glycosyltransferase (TIGR04348 family)